LEYNNIYFGIFEFPEIGRYSKGPRVSKWTETAVICKIYTG
jgi:hypothetical protein